MEQKAKKDITFSNLDDHIDITTKKLKIISTNKWYVRLWYIITNPLCYIFIGYVRY